MQVIHDEWSREAILDREVQKYVNWGYRIISRTPTTAQLVKPKRFSPILAFLGLLIAVVGLVIYIIIYLAMDDTLVYITVDVNGTVHQS
jgi:energy-converting hydrogenase Eha subunit E